MVKFKIPGNRVSIKMSDGHNYVGEAIYDNDIYKLPLEDIKPFIIGNEPVKEVPKENTVPVQTLQEKLKKKYTLKELKEKAKTIDLKVKASIKEEEIIELLVKNGYHE